ncbi:MAG: Gfo/Idh/MocA family protein [Lachnospiraceae bacterium]
MKMGIAGAGMIAAELLNFAHEVEGLEITAICATPKSEDKLKGLCSRYGIPVYYLDYEQMAADEMVEVVYLATPNCMHYDMCKTAIAAGKHIICEKPFTSNAAEARELIRLAKEKDVIILEAVTTNYLPNMLAVKKHLPELGDIKVVTANYSQYSSRYDAWKAGQIMPAFNPEMSGGALMDLNVYNINLMVFLFGRPLSVNYMANIERGIDTSGILTMDYGSFKCICIGAKDCKAPVTSNIQGISGCLTIPFPTNTVDGFTVLSNQGDTVSYDYNDGRHRMYHEFVKFVDVIENGDSEFARDMLAITEIVMDILTEARDKAGIIFPADRLG